MTTLVIHPKDHTTAFLTPIYTGKDWTVIDTSISKKSLKQAIKTHDRVVILGHGSDKGLFGYGRFVIDSTLVYTLRNKDVICIWCNADLFVKKYGLRGLHTGMIISDYEEALFYCVRHGNADIEKSNTLFAQAMKDAIDSETKVLTATSIYSDDENPIVSYNRLNIFEN